eukprot:scaffold72905_cov32-Tisochrysis_lutea.AAC.1
MFYKHATNVCKCMAHRHAILGLPGPRWQRSWTVFKHVASSALHLRRESRSGPEAEPSGP